jgi:probable HAF family extracellular repeat protein
MATTIGSNIASYGINERGDVVGIYVGTDGQTHGFLLNGS